MHYSNIAIYASVTVIFKLVEILIFGQWSFTSPTTIPNERVPFVKQGTAIRNGMNGTDFQNHKSHG
jgi:hypothetical protein